METFIKFRMGLVKPKRYRGTVWIWSPLRSYFTASNSYLIKQAVAGSWDPCVYEKNEAFVWWKNKANQIQLGENL